MKHVSFPDFQNCELQGHWSDGEILLTEGYHLIEERDLTDAELDQIQECDALSLHAEAVERG